MTKEIAREVQDEKSLMEIRNDLPYQYASIIKARLDKKDGASKKISAQQIRLVFYGEITDPTIVLPVLEQASVLLEEMQRVKSISAQLREKKSKKAVL